MKFIKDNFYLERFLAFLGGLSVIGIVVFLFLDWKISLALLAFLVITFAIRKWMKS